MRSSVFDAHLGGDLVEDRLEVLRAAIVSAILATQRLEVLDDVLAAGLAVVVLLDHLADALQDLARHALGRETA